MPQPATFCRAAVAPGAYTLRRHTLNIKPFKTVILNRGTYACSRHKAFGILVCVQPSLRIQGLWHAVHTSCMAARAHRTVITTVAMTIRIQLTRVYRHPARKINLSVRFPSPYRKNRRTLLLFPGSADYSSYMHAPAALHHELLQYRSTPRITPRHNHSGQRLGKLTHQHAPTGVPKYLRKADFSFPLSLFGDNSTRHAPQASYSSLGQASD